MDSSFPVCCFLFGLALSTVGGLHVNSDSEPFVTCPAGDFVGTTALIKDIPIHQFLGIRYAKAPIGNLRFAKPVPAEKPPGTVNATSFGPICPQLESKGIRTLQSEDCLFLNLYVPEVTNDTTLPVMVFIHGGAYVQGSGDLYNGSVLASQGRVIVITLNYRLGALGHLSTEDSASPGNYALWDQQLALQWVQQNVGCFKGNTKAVTIFGESAGAKYAALHTVSSVNNGLFQRAIMESGTIFSPWTFSYLPKERLLQPTIQKTGCVGTTADIVSCLRQLPVINLVELNFLPWAPVRDGDFLQYTPMDIKAQVPQKPRSDLLEKFSNYDLFMGFNSQEGLLQAGAILRIAEMYNETIDKGISEKVLRTCLDELITGFYTLHNGDLMSRIIVNGYNKTYKFTTPKQRLIQLIKIIGDARYVGPTIDFARVHANLNGTGRTFMYEFDHRRASLHGLIPYEGPDWLRVGADHTDELFMVFGFGYEDQLYEKRLSEAMMSYWSNFATNGLVTSYQSHDLFIDAKEYGGMDDEYYLTISTNFSSVAQHARPHIDYLWNDLLPSFIQADLDMDTGCH